MKLLMSLVINEKQLLGCAQGNVRELRQKDTYGEFAVNG